MCHFPPPPIPDLQRCFLGECGHEDRMFSEGSGIMHGLTPGYLCCRWCLETWYGRQSGQQSPVSHDFSLSFFKLLAGQNASIQWYTIQLHFLPNCFPDAQRPLCSTTNTKILFTPPTPHLSHTSISWTSLWVSLLLRKQVACWVNRQRPDCPAPLRVQD